MDLNLLAAIAGLATGLIFLLAALRSLGEFMNQWAGEAELEVAPPAEHPYEPNGGPRGAVPTFTPQAGYPSAIPAAPRFTAGLPGRRKDNAHDRIDAAASARN